jgi:hypothetical protein
MGSRVGGKGAAEGVHICKFTRSRNSRRDERKDLLFWLLYLTVPQPIEGVCQYKDNQKPEYGNRVNSRNVFHINYGPIWVENSAYVGKKGMHIGFCGTARRKETTRKTYM